MKFIENVSSEKLDELKKIFKNSNEARIRLRAHAIMLSIRKFSIDEISDFYEVDRDSVSSWFNRWNERGIEGLSDLPKEGRPQIIFQDFKKKY